MTTHTSFRIFHTVKSFVPAAIAIAALLTASAAHAQVTEITATQFALLNNPTNVPITGTPMDPPQLVYAFSAAGQTLTLSNGGTAVNGKILQRRNQQGPGSTTGGNFAGDFAVDEPLIDNVVSSSTTSIADGLNIAFSAPVNAFGFNFDPSIDFVPTTFTLVVNTLGGGQTSFTRPGVASSDADDGTAPFFGIRDAGGNLITSVLLYGVADIPSGLPGSNPSPNDFAVGLLRFNISPTAPPPSVPEPGSIALLIGITATGAGCLARHKRLIVNK